MLQAFGDCRSVWGFSLGVMLSQSRSKLCDSPRAELSNVRLTSGGGQGRIGDKYSRVVAEEER